jgi:hypothetical protein
MTALAARDGRFALALWLRTTFQKIDDSFAGPAGTEPADREIAAEWARLKGLKVEVDTWLVAFRRAGADVRARRLLALTDAERAIAASLDAEVAAELAEAGTARRVARAVAAQGPYALLRHFVAATPAVREHLRADAGADSLAGRIRSAIQTLQEFDAATHARRLATVTRLTVEERAALRDVVGKLSGERNFRIGPFPRAQAWLREFDQMLAQLTSTARGSGPIGLLWETHLGDAKDWKELCVAVPELRQAYQRGRQTCAAVLAAADKGDHTTFADLWHTVAVADRTMLAQLVPRAGRLLRTEEQLRAQVLAAARAHGYLGVLAFFAEPGQDWRNTAPLSAELVRAKDKATAWLAGFDRMDASRRAREVINADEDLRAMFLLVSAGARAAYRRAELVRNELTKVALERPLKDVWTHWLTVAEWYTGLAGQDGTAQFLRAHLLPDVAERVLTAEHYARVVVPSLLGRSDTELDRALLTFSRAEIVELARFDRTLAQRVRLRAAAAHGRRVSVQRTIVDTIPADRLHALADPSASPAADGGVLIEVIARKG